MKSPISVSNCGGCGNGRAKCNSCKGMIQEWSNEEPVRRKANSQGRNQKENLGATGPMVGRICPPGWNRVSENLGATSVTPVAPVDTSLQTGQN